MWTNEKASRTIESQVIIVEDGGREKECMSDVEYKSNNNKVMINSDCYESREVMYREEEEKQEWMEIWMGEEKVNSTEMKILFTW